MEPLTPGRIGNAIQNRMVTRLIRTPCLLIASSGDFRLMVDSPCSNAGVDAGVKGKDYYDNPVPSGKFDIGVYERNAAGTAKTSACRIVIFTRIPPESPGISEPRMRGEMPDSFSKNRLQFYLILAYSLTSCVYSFISLADYWNEIQSPSSELPFFYCPCVF